MVQTTMGDLPQVKMVSTLEPDSRMLTPQQIPTYTVNISGRLNSVKEPHLQRTHGIVGICLKRHPGLRQLVQHSGEANMTSSFP